jgi:hypothetical protein
MEAQDDFLSPMHKRLLNIATWAKYLAWAAIVFTIFATGCDVFLRYFKALQEYQLMTGAFQNANTFLSIYFGDPLYWLDSIFGVINVVLRGVVYFLVLKGISLGLNMIVETDINYRETQAVGETNE